MAKTRKKKSQLSANLNTFKQRLFGTKQSARFGRNRIDPKVIFTDLHMRENFQEIAEIAEYLKNSNNPYHKFIYGKPFASSSEDIFSSAFATFTGNVEKDLNWMSLSVIRYANEISSFIEKSIEFQKAFLIGNYILSEEILNHIESVHGTSLWLLNKKFLLFEYMIGIEENKKLLSDIVGNKNNDILLRVLAEYLSLRCEKKISTENYLRRLDKYLEDDEKETSSFVSYLTYRLGSINNSISENASLIAAFEGALPVIDRYCSLISILQQFSAANEHIELASSIVFRLNKLITDERIDSLVKFFNPNERITNNYVPESYFDLLNLYTEGRYQEATYLSAKMLYDNPDIFDLYYIHCRSIEYYNSETHQIFSKDSIAAGILKHTHIIIQGSSTWKESANSIMKYSLSLWRDPIAYSLFEFYEKEASPCPNALYNKLALLNGKHYNPRFANIYENQEKSANYLSVLSQSMKQCSTISLTLALTTTSKEKEDFQLPVKIPKSRRQIYSATIYDSIGKPQKAIEVLEPLLLEILEGKVEGGFHTHDRVVKTLFRCYLQVEKLFDCTIMVINSFFQNELTTKKLSLELLIEKIEKHTPSDLMHDFSYPILYTLVKDKPRDIYIAYDNFLNHIGVERPTQLFSSEKSHLKNTFIYFLYHVCTIDILACSYHFTGTKDLESERIRICQFLSEIDPYNSKKYSDEISRITSKSLIKEGMRHIDVSKIYVDETGIRNSDKGLLKENFSRYRELASIDTIESLKMMNTDSLSFVFLTDDGQLIRQRVSKDDFDPSALGRAVVLNSRFLLFNELFFDIRDRFISSGEYGVSGDLIMFLERRFENA